MPVYRVDTILHKNSWWIEEVTYGKLTFNYNVPYDADIELEEGMPAVPGKVMWVEQPTLLAAFAQALMIFNGESREV